MAIALVKAGTLAATLSPAFGQSTTAGSLLVAWVAQNGSSSGTNPFTVTGTGWTLAFATGAAYQWGAVYCKPGCGAGETAPTFSASGTTNASVLAEFSGAATSSPLDSSGISATATATNAAHDTGGGDLIVVLATDNNYDGAALAASSMHDSSGASVTPVSMGGAYNSGLGWAYGFAYGFAGSGGSSADTVTFNYTTYSGIVSFMAPGGTNTSPAWAASYDTTAVSGTGTWVNPANAEGAADGSFAVWTAT